MGGSPVGARIQIINGQKLFGCKQFWFWMVFQNRTAQPFQIPTNSCLMDSHVLVWFSWSDQMSTSKRSDFEWVLNLNVWYWSLHYTYTLKILIMNTPGKPGQRFNKLTVLSSNWSEIPPSLDFEWSKRGWVANGLDFKWDLKSRSPTVWNPDKGPPFCPKSFEIRTKTFGFWMFRDFKWLDFRSPLYFIAKLTSQRLIKIAIWWILPQYSCRYTLNTKWG